MPRDTIPDEASRQAGSVRLLDVRNLKIAVASKIPGGRTDQKVIVDDVSFSLEKGKVLGLIRGIRRRQIYHRTGLHGIWARWMSDCRRAGHSWRMRYYEAWKR